MSRKSLRSHAVVERLLEERKQYQEWIAKLDAVAVDAAPSTVLERVRADYESRLKAVTKELARHAGSLEHALSEAEKRNEDLCAQRAQREESLAEAEVRHDVGEFDDARFTEASAEARAALKELGEAIEAAERDMARYEDILALISGTAGLAEPAGVDSGSPASPAPAAPTSEEAAALGKAATQLDALDELAFLRSVTASVVEHEKPGVAAPATPPEPPVAQPTKPITPPAAATANSRKQRRPSAEARGAEEEGKRLRCAECGTPNYPTEWYCEKCGAELSAF